ncbi:MAG: hypothetical protein PVI30_18040 [Myxococcales bacterium]
MDELSDELDAIEEAQDGDRGSSRPPPTRKRPTGPGPVTRLRNHCDEKPRQAAALAGFALVASVLALAVFLSDPRHESDWGEAEASQVSELLVGGHREGSHFEGELDVARWSGLTAAQREAEADALRDALKYRGIFNAELRAEGLERPAIVIEFARVTSLAP